MVERIINKIVNEKIDIDSLLVVTFTNAAAAEMRERILNAIYKIIDDDEEKDEEKLNHLQKQITLLNKANICTIDSFCLDVIRNNFFEIDISPNFRIADTAEIDLLKQESLEKIFEEKYENLDSDFEKLIKTYTSYRGDEPLKELVLKIYNFIGANPFPLKWLDEKIEEFDVKDIKQDFSKNPWGKILLNEMKEELEDNIKKIGAEIRRLEVEPELDIYAKTLNSDIVELEILYANLDSWDKAFQIANNIKFVKWPSSRKITSEEKEKAKSIRDKIKKSFTSTRDKIFTSNSEEANIDLKEMYETLSKLKNLIIEFDTEFKANKKEKNIVDFSDIEHLALEILLKEKDGKYESSEIARKYQEKFTEIAIDEYQDSNLVQEYILTSVSKGNNIFMVGDVKQSIYKFRQANPELFLDKYKKFSIATDSFSKEDKKLQKRITPNLDNPLAETVPIKANGQKIKLFKNFRSRDNVLNFTNMIFENIMGESLGEIDYTEEEYLNLGANYEESKQNLITEIDILDTVEDDCIQQNKENVLNNSEDQSISISTENAEDVEKDTQEEQERIEDIELEARFVAGKIRDLIDSKFQVYDNKKEVFRNVEFKDIVILLRSTKNKACIFEKELIKQNINVYSDTSSEYLDSYEIQVIMDLLKIIDNPYQDLPLVHVMLSSIGMFTDDDLLEIRLTDKQDDFYTSLLKSRLSVNDNLKEKIEIFLEKIASWREKNTYMDLDELIWTIYEETGFLNYVALMPNGALRVANLKMLFERAKQYETVSFKGLFNFIGFMEKVKTGSGDLGSAKLIGENENVVRIMSIHKSKGLEFPIVFLASSGNSFNMMDLNTDILLHQNFGIGVKYIDYDKQIKYDTLTKQALKEKILQENTAEEMRVLYVALTRAKEKIYITSIKKDFEKEMQKMQELVDIYNKEKGKINPILLKKYKKYIDWILLVYLYNREESKEVMNINVLKKQDILKNMKEELEEEIDIFSLLEEEAKSIKEEDLFELKNKLAFNYKYRELANIPTKESVTNIVHKTINQGITVVENENIQNDEFYQEEIVDDIDYNEQEGDIEFAKPKFLIGTDEEEISPSKRGTLVHLCMKNLDFEKDYNMQDVKDLIEDLKNREIITIKEAESINPKVILNFTQSNIFKELKLAKEYHKEAPFYINIAANRVMNVDAGENILVQGIIDLYYIDKDDKLVLLDYKTDFVKEGEEQILIDRHKKQLMLYKEALEGALGKKVDRVYIYSTGLNTEIAI